MTFANENAKIVELRDELTERTRRDGKEEQYWCFSKFFNGNEVDCFEVDVFRKLNVQTEMNLLIL